MVYGEKIAYGDAMDTVTDLAGRAQQA